jgi:hypothetical protein
MKLKTYLLDPSGENNFHQPSQRESTATWPIAPPASLYNEMFESRKGHYSLRKETGNQTYTQQLSTHGCRTKKSEG